MPEVKVPVPSGVDYYGDGSEDFDVSYIMVPEKFAYSIVSGERTFLLSLYKFCEIAEMADDGYYFFGWRWNHKQNDPLAAVYFSLWDGRERPGSFINMVTTQMPFQMYRRMLEQNRDDILGELIPIYRILKKAWETRPKGSCWGGRVRDVDET